MKILFFSSKNYYTLEKKVWQLSEELNVLSIPHCNYSTLEEEVWPLTGESKVNSLSRMLLLNAKKGSLAIFSGTNYLAL